MALEREALASVSLEPLLDKISSQEFLNFFGKKKLKVSLLDELKETLVNLSGVVEDAEEKQTANDEVRIWFARLKDVLFDAEDLVDEIDTHFLRCKVEEEQQNAKNLVRKFLPSTFNLFYKEINSKMKKMSRRLSELARTSDRFDFQIVRRVFFRTLTTPSIHETSVVGRDEEKEALMKMLLSDDDATGVHIGVAAILGMGGIGKTTLAQLLYNDKQVQDHFDLKGWVVVSDDFDVTKMIKSFLESITSKSYDEGDPGSLRFEIKQKLNNKIFFLVLDDLWNENHWKWNDLIRHFSSGKRGSRILVTTRSHQVATVVSAFHICHLCTLSDEQCLSIFVQHAFGNGGFNIYESSEEIARRIVGKCCGLPLAAKLFGGMLRSKLDAGEWNKILNSDIWDRGNDLMSVLDLSYFLLPAPLKRCFAYCSIFPKNYQLDRKKLILLWMAEGLVQQFQSEKRMEDVGDEYFVELVSRSLIQQFDSSNEEHFVMHDIVHNLAYNCFIDEYGDATISANGRHLSFKMGQFDTLKELETFNGLNGLRSFIAFPNFEASECRLSRKAFNDLLLKLRSLRVLSLSGFSNITEIPNSIGNLMHLRYLNLSHTAIQRLPKEICILCNLQTLICSYCYSLLELPAKIGKLVNLRHLDIMGSTLKKTPQISKLRSLQTLIGFVVMEMLPLQICRSQIFQTWTKFIVGRQYDGLQIGELREFPNIQGTVCIEGLGNVVDSADALEADLKTKEQIEQLELEWGDITEDSAIAKEVLEQLQPCTKLRKLTVQGYSGINFPSWLGDSSFSNMVYLKIGRCEHCWSLPPLGQLPFMKELYIFELRSVLIIDTDFYGSASFSFQPFPSLQRLSFYDMQNWEKWLQWKGGDDRFPFPSLKWLQLHDCPKLRGYLPYGLPPQLDFDISGCPQLVFEEQSHAHAAYAETSRSTNIPKEVQQVASETSMESLLEEANFQSKSDAASYAETSRSTNDPHTDAYLLPRSDAAVGIQGVFYQSDDSMDALSDVDTFDSFSSFEILKVSDVSQLRELPQRLHSLRIEGCHYMESLAKELVSRSLNLSELYMIDCSSLKDFVDERYCTSLITLYIHKCGKLEFPSPSVTIQNFACLQHLCIGSSYDSLESFALDLFPKLKTLRIWDCPHLKSLSISEGFQGDSLKLESLVIRDCPRLASFPVEGLPAPDLISIAFSNCKTLPSLPNNMASLESLQSIFLDRCPKLESFPAGGLPSTLDSLSIAFSNKLIPLKEWELQRLHSLSCFEIESGCIGMGLFPAKDLLPINLRSLRISKLSGLTSLDPMGLHDLTSLESLEINCCEKLDSLPDKGLPSSLSFVCIKECPILTQKLLYKAGAEWHKIAWIPNIQINDNLISSNSTRGSFISGNGIMKLTSVSKSVDYCYGPGETLYTQEKNTMNLSRRDHTRGPTPLKTQNLKATD